MASEWIECTLSDACRAIDYGLTASASVEPSAAHFLRITDIEGGRIDWDSVPFVNASPEVIDKYRLDHGDVVIARTGASTGRSAFLQHPPVAAFASYLVRLKAKPEFDSRFLYYYLNSPLFWDFLRGVLGDKSAQPNASASTMTKAPFIAPKDMGEQRAISALFGLLDDRIASLSKLNRTLEDLAGAIFKSWFVDFDPVRAKAEGREPEGMDAATAALFPSAFGHFSGESVPSGWNSLPLDEMAHFLNGLALQKYAAVAGEDSLPAIKIAQLKRGSAEGADPVSMRLPAQYILEDGDLIFSWSGSLEVVVWCGGQGALNQHLFKVTSAKYPLWFVYGWLLEHLPHFREIAASKVTTMGHIQRHDLHEATALVPDPPTLAKLGETLAPLFERSVQCRLQARTLAELRDTLLPRLISGKLRVPEAEKLVEAVL